jgi:hypothetical protein
MRRNLARYGQFQDMFSEAAKIFGCFGCILKLFFTPDVRG